MAIDIGDAVLTFLGDTTQLDAALNRVGAEVPAKLAPAEAALGGLGAGARQFGEELCKNGSHVRFFEIKGGGHSFAAFHSAHAAVTWMADRFAGLPAPSDCRD